MQLLTRLRLDLIRLREQKFNHNFQDILTPICSFNEDIETLFHYLLHCSLYTIKRLVLLNVILGIDNCILELDDSHIAGVIL